MSLGAVLAFLLSVLDTAVSYVIPAYFSCKSLSNHNGVETWLTYFLVLGLLRVFEWIFGLLLRYLFFFPLLKLAFVIWLQLPQTKGAQVVYAQLIAPLFKAHSPKIDKFIDASHARVHQQMKELGFVHSTTVLDDQAASGFEGLSRPVNRYAASGGAMDTPDEESLPGGTNKAR